jgi:hypothetical protein
LYNLVNIMPDAKALQEYDHSLTDDELLNLKSEGGFTSATEVLPSHKTSSKLVDDQQFGRFHGIGSQKSCATGRITISLTSTSAGCSIA